MYDKEAGVIACDSCDITIEGYGFSIGAGNVSPAVATAGNVLARSWSSCWTRTTRK